MNKGQKIKIIVSGVFVLFLSVGTFIASLDKEIGEEDVNVVMGTEDFKGVPKIISVAPLSVKAGDMYIYDIKVVDSDSDSFFVEFVERPPWLYIEDDHIVKGLAEEKGSFKFVIRVSDGDHYSFQENYILVEGYE